MSLLVLPDGRTRISGSGRVSPRLAGCDSICFSPVTTDLEDSVGCVIAGTSAVSNSSLAFKAVVSDPSFGVNRATLSSAKQTRPIESVRRVSLASTARPVETVGVASGPTGPLLECSQRARDTVLNVRAAYTSKLYSCKWKVFCDWCSSREIDPLQHSVGCILDLLQHLLELGRSASTLKVYVAALSAHRSEFGASSLESDQLIVTFLKAANCYCLLWSVRSPTWDLIMVLSSLCQPPFEPILESDIKWLSFKTAFLLAITTAKLLSELHALSVSAPCLRWSADFSSVSLWPNPAFLPKILSPHFMNTPIVLAALPSDQDDIRLELQ